MSRKSTLRSTVGPAALIALLTIGAYTIPMWGSLKWPLPAAFAAVALLEVVLGVRALWRKSAVGAWQHWFGALAFACFTVFFDWTRTKLELTTPQAGNAAAAIALLLGVVSVVLYAERSRNQDA